MPFKTDAQRKAVMANLNPGGISESSVNHGPVTSRLTDKNLMLNKQIPVPLWNEDDTSAFKKLMTEMNIDNWHHKESWKGGSLFGNSANNLHLRVSSNHSDAYVASSSQLQKQIPTNLRFFDTKEDVAEYMANFMSSENELQKDWNDASAEQRADTIRFQLGYNKDYSEQLAKIENFDDLTHELKIKMIEKEMNRS